MSEDEDLEVMQICVQRKRFRVCSDKAVPGQNHQFLPDISAENLKKEKLEFFQTKVFCEDLSSLYHYEKFHKNMNKDFPDEPS